MSLLLRRRELISRYWDYELYDQTYDGSNYTITPLMLYTAENIGKSCKIIMKVDSIIDNAYGTFFSTMQEISPYPGMVLRLKSNTPRYLDMAGLKSVFLTNYLPTDFEIELTRDGSTGIWSALLSNNLYTSDFANTQFVQPLTIGAAYQGDGTTFFRYGQFHLGYFKFKWL